MPSSERPFNVLRAGVDDGNSIPLAAVGWRQVLLHDVWQSQSNVTVKVVFLAEPAGSA